MHEKESRCDNCNGVFFTDDLRVTKYGWKICRECSPTYLRKNPEKFRSVNPDFNSGIELLWESEII